MRPILAGLLLLTGAVLAGCASASETNEPWVVTKAYAENVGSHGIFVVEYTLPDGRTAKWKGEPIDSVRDCWVQAIPGYRIPDCVRNAGTPTTVPGRPK